MKKITFAELVQKILKYITEGLIVSLVFYLVFDKNRDYKSIITVGLTASSIFAILDLFAPNVSHFVRSGAGVGVGYGITRPDNIMLPIPNLPM